MNNNAINRPIRILIVEDDSTWKRILKRKLNAIFKDSSRPLYVHAESEFNEALDVLETDSPWNLLITDIGLGKGNVTRQKLGKHLAEFAYTQGVPTVVVSGTPVLEPNDIGILFSDYKIRHFFSKKDFKSDKFVEVINSIIFESKSSHQEQKSHFISAQPQEDSIVDVAAFNKDIKHQNLLEIKTALNALFTSSELREICFDLQIDFENLPGKTKADKARELVSFCARNNQISDLVAIVKQFRPKWNYSLMED